MPLLSSSGASASVSTSNAAANGAATGFHHPSTFLHAMANYDQVQGSFNALIGSISGALETSATTTTSSSHLSSNEPSASTYSDSSIFGDQLQLQTASVYEEEASGSATSRTTSSASTSGSMPLWWESIQNQRPMSSPPAAFRRVGFQQSPRQQQQQQQEVYALPRRGSYGSSGKPQQQFQSQLHDQVVYETAPVMPPSQPARVTTTNPTAALTGTSTGLSGSRSGSGQIKAPANPTNEDLRMFRSRVVAAIENMFRNHSPHLVLTQVPENVNWQSKTFKLALKIEKLLFLSVKNHVNASANGAVDASLYATAYLQLSAQQLRQRVQILAKRLLKTRTQRHGQGPTSHSLESTMATAAANPTGGNNGSTVNSNGNGSNMAARTRPRY